MNREEIEFSSRLFIFGLWHFKIQRQSIRSLHKSEIYFCCFNNGLSVIDTGIYRMLFDRLLITSLC